MICPNCRKEIAEYSNFCSFCGARQAEVAAARRVGPKRLMRSSTDSKVGGVCGGLRSILKPTRALCESL